MLNKSIRKKCLLIPNENKKKKTKKNLFISNQIVL